MTTLPLGPEPFTVAMAAAHGINRNRLAEMIRGGLVRHIFHDVYVACGVADSVTLRAQAAHLVMPENSVVCDRSAA